jgi:hypothetical protein
MNLGLIEHNIKFFKYFSDHHEDLIEIGIDVNFLSSSKNPTFEGIIFGFETYKMVHNIEGKFDIPARYIVPLTSPWPARTWGMNLGSIQSTIRSQNLW